MRPAPATTERVARNALLKLAVQGTRLLSLLVVVLAARWLGPEAFGKFTFAYALAALAGAVLDLGMHSLLVREVARTPAAAGAHWGAAASLKLGLLGPAALILVAVPLATARPVDATHAVWLLGAALALQSFIELAVAVFTGFERLEVELRVRLVEKGLLFTLGVGGLWLGGGLRWLSGAFALAAAASLLWATRLVHRRFAPLGGRWAPARTWALARALAPVAGAFVLSFATTRVIPLLVALLAGDRAAGHFGAGLRVLDAVGVVPVAVVAGVYPVLARTPARDGRFREGVTQSATMLVLLGAPIALGLVFGAPALTRLVYGAAYGPTAPALAVLGAAVCLGFLNHFFGFVLLALDRPGRLLALGAAGLAAGLALTPPLARSHGAIGGAMALVLVEAVMLGGGVLGLAPLVGVPLGGGVLRTLGAAGLAAGGAVLAPPGPWQLAVALGAYGVGVLALRPIAPARWGQIARGLLGRPWPGAAPGGG